MSSIQRLLHLYHEHLLPHIIVRACSSPEIAQERAQVVPAAEGRVLEIGIGAGHNLDHYRPGQVERIWGLDPSPALLAWAQERLPHLRIPVELLEGSAEAIPLEDASVDTVVTTFTLCSVPEVQRALAEMRRVLRPGGQVLFLEHGAAPEPWVRRLQDRLNPAWRIVAGGCHLNRSMDRLFREGGFELPELRAEYGLGPRVVGFLYKGKARPR